MDVTPDLAMKRVLGESHQVKKSSRHTAISSTNPGGAHFTQAGFSLLEVLVSLAIVSVTSVVIFQSLSVQFNLTTSIQRSISETLSETSRRKGWESVIEDLIPGWPELEAEQFIGTPDQLRGLTAVPLDRVPNKLAEFSMVLDDGNTRLIYLPADGSPIELYNFENAANFSYMGLNGQWYEKWPPDEIPDAGRFDDSDLYEMPPLPVAVRIQTIDRSKIDWIAILNWQSQRLPRYQDTEID